MPLMSMRYRHSKAVASRIERGYQAASEYLSSLPETGVRPPPTGGTPGALSVRSGCRSGPRLRWPSSLPRLSPALAAPLSRRRRPSRLALFAALYLAVDVSLVAGCAALWLRFPRPARRDPARWTKAHLRLLGRALTVLVAAARPLLGFSVEVHEPPDRDLIAGRPLLVLARHGGPGDSFALVQLLMSRYQRCPAIVLKEALRWDPGLDVILGRLPSCFIRRGDGARMARRLTDLARNMQQRRRDPALPRGGQLDAAAGTAGRSPGCGAPGGGRRRLTRRATRTCCRRAPPECWPACGRDPIWMLPWLRIPAWKTW